MHSRELVMMIDEFMQTRLFGFLYSAFCLCALAYFAYQTGMARGYRDGWAAGRAENPKPEVLVVSEYIFDDKRIARFDPRSPDYFLIMDFSDRTIARVPTHDSLKKDVIVEKREETANENSCE